MACGMMKCCHPVCCGYKCPDCEGKIRCGWCDAIADAERARKATDIVMEAMGKYVDATKRDEQG